MSQTQSEAAGASTTTTEEGGLGLLDQVIGATKQTEKDRAQDLIKALTEEAYNLGLNDARVLDRVHQVANKVEKLDAQGKPLYSYKGTQNKYEPQNAKIGSLVALIKAKKSLSSSDMSFSA